jgi:hypothetical protein
MIIGTCDRKSAKEKDGLARAVSTRDGSMNLVIRGRQR